MTTLPDEKFFRTPVTDIRTWVPGKLFSLRVERQPGFVFTAGQFARLGLQDPATPEEAPALWRAYSMVSGADDPYLEFYSVVVPEGQFSPRLAALQPGDMLCVDRTPFGFLTADRLHQNGDLWLIATGTGLGPYLSILKEQSVWQAFDRIIVVHGVRHADELAYRDTLSNLADQAPWCDWGVAGNDRFLYLPIATREALPGMPQERLTTLIENGDLARLADSPLDPQRARVMLCGNPDMITQARKMLSERGFAPGRRGAQGNLAVENYW